ncbi:hypothetical protein GCM10017776_17950 [Streptomyces griseoluteus]|nr:hypothetical protein GCM10017776_17950 [Streptomyces griseoluteus]
MGAAIDHVVTESLNGLADGIFERISGVVRAEGDLHRWFLSGRANCLPSDWGRRLWWWVWSDSDGECVVRVSVARCAIA